MNSREFNFLTAIARALVCLCMSLTCLLLFSEGASAQVPKIGTVKNADGSTTVTERDNESYGKDGFRETTRDASGKVTKVVKKDKAGVKREETDISYPKTGGRQEVTRRYKKDGVTLIDQTTLEFDLFNTEVYRENVQYDETGRRIIGGSATGIDENGKKKNYKYNPDAPLGKQWEPVESATAPPSDKGGKAGAPTTTKSLNGLTTTIVTTSLGRLTVNLTDDLAAGETFSGTVSAEPAGRTPEERAQNQGELSGYVLEMENQRTTVGGNTFTRTIPVTATTASLVLRNRKGEKEADIYVPVSSRTDERRTPTPTPGDFQLPAIGQTGRPLEISGPLDGSFATTSLKVGGSDARLLAESPRKVVAQSPADVVGPTEIEFKENGVVARGEFRNLAIRLAAPKTNLLRGEQTTLTVTVSGLEGLREAVPLDLENLSPEVVSVAGGEMQQITIRPEEVQAGGVYTTTRTLTGVRAGAFSITATVTRRGRAPEKNKEKEAGKGAAPAAGGALAGLKEDLIGKLTGAKKSADEAKKRAGDAAADAKKRGDDDGAKASGQREKGAKARSDEYDRLIKKAQGAKTKEELDGIKKEMEKIDEATSGRRDLEKRGLKPGEIDEIVDEFIGTVIAQGGTGEPTADAYRKKAEEILRNKGINRPSEDDPNFRKKLDAYEAERNKLIEELKKLFKGEGK